MRRVRSTIQALDILHAFYVNILLYILPETAIGETITSTGSALLTQASPPWRPHSRIENVFWRFGSGPRHVFYSASAARLEGSSFKSSAGS